MSQSTNLHKYQSHPHFTPCEFLNKMVGFTLSTLCSSGPLLSILADLNNAVANLVLDSSNKNEFSKSLATVQSALNTIDIKLSPSRSNSFLLCPVKIWILLFLLLESFSHQADADGLLQKFK